MEFGEYIKSLRINQGLSGREVARRAKISQAYLSQLERGDNKNPSLELLEKLANGLGISKLELIAKSGTLDIEDIKNLSDDDFLLINIYNKEQSIKEEIINKLKILTDEAGFFYKKYWKELFEAVESNLYISFYGPDHESMKKYFKNYFSLSDDGFVFHDEEEAEQYFYKIYDIRNVIKAIKSSSTTTENLEKFNSSLNNILIKHNISIPSEKAQETDLKVILENPNLVYNNLFVTDNDKQLIRSYLEALFSARDN